MAYLEKITLADADFTKFPASVQAQFARSYNADSAIRV
jgi:hypothetical protein